MLQIQQSSRFLKFTINFWRRSTLFTLFFKYWTARIAHNKWTISCQKSWSTGKSTVDWRGKTLVLLPKWAQLCPKNMKWRNNSI